MKSNRAVRQSSLIQIFIVWVLLKDDSIPEVTIILLSFNNIESTVCVPWNTQLNSSNHLWLGSHSTSKRLIPKSGHPMLSSDKTNPIKLPILNIFDTLWSDILMIITVLIFSQLKKYFRMFCFEEVFKRRSSVVTFVKRMDTFSIGMNMINCVWSSY